MPSMGGDFYWRTAVTGDNINSQWQITLLLIRTYAGKQPEKPGICYWSLKGHTRNAGLEATPEKGKDSQINMFKLLFSKEF